LNPGVEIPCLLCGAREYSEIKRFPDEGVVVGRCRSCGLLYTPRRHTAPESLLAGASVEELRILYRPILEGRKRHFRASNFRDYLRIIESRTQGRRLLDVGCAHGFFPALARSRGWQVLAVEPSRAMSRVAREFLGLDVLEGRLDEVALDGRTFDAISFTDSAEYLPEPRRDLGRAIGHLAPGGVIFMKVPNGDYFRLRHALENLVGRPLGEEAFSPPQRVGHYTLATLRRLAEALGLVVIETRSCAPVHSPVWWPLTGLWLEMEGPWMLGLGPRLVRRGLHALGRLEETVTGRNHLSPSIYLLARRSTSA